MNAGALEAELGPGVDVETHAETGRVRFIGTQPGAAIAAPDDGSPRAAALSFVDSISKQLGGPEGDLDVARTEHLPGGRSVVRLQQTERGATVTAGELAVNVDDDNQVLSVSGELSPPSDLSTDPVLTAAEADDFAYALVSKHYGVSADDLRAREPELSIFDNRIVGGPGSDRPVLTWQTEVTSVAASGEPIQEFVAVDARSGAIVAHFNQIAEAVTNRVCDAANTNSRVPCSTPYARTESSAASGIADAEAAFQYAADTYDFYLNRFGRNSINGAGLPLVSTTRYCRSGSEVPPKPCPYNNAYWDSNNLQMVYGQGLVVDDVVGHELTHGVTQFTSGLYYYYQSGAINESLSDVFGEFIDLTNGAGTDTAGVRWQIGEDAAPYYANSCTAGPELRNMANPTQCGDPDKMTSPSYSADASFEDQGGVHTNSGVNNKAAYLMTDGGSFNGQSITGLGITKVARIYYLVNTSLLTSGSDYQDLGAALRQSCYSLIGTAGITSTDCAQVSKAVTATEMDTTPPAAPAPEAPTCGGGPSSTFFFDDMESGNAWTSGGTGSQWKYATGYATSGDRSLLSGLYPTTADATMTSPAFTVPASAPEGAYLRFRHSYAFERGVTNYDGGVVEYSTNNGASWTDAGPLFTHGGYGGSLYAGNPLAGRSAFIGLSHGYLSSRLNLASLVGQTLRIRFRFGADGSTAISPGWLIDDVRAYKCGVDTDKPETGITGGPAAGSTTSTASDTFSFSSNEPGSTFQCSIDAGAYGPCTSPRTVSGLASGTHRFSVRARDPAGNVDDSPAVRTWMKLSPAPETQITSGPAFQAVLTQHSATFGFVSDRPATFQCQLDDEPYAACSSPTTLTGMDNGSHTFRVRAVAGGLVDPSPAARSFSVEAGPGCDEALATLSRAKSALKRAKTKLKKAKKSGKRAKIRKAERRVQTAKKRKVAANILVGAAC